MKCLITIYGAGYFDCLIQQLTVKTKSDQLYKKTRTTVRDGNNYLSKFSQHIPEKSAIYDFGIDLQE